jgi:hypothetical protein
LQAQIHKLLPLAAKFKYFLNYIVGPLLFIGIGWSIYSQISAQPDLAAHREHIISLLQAPGKGYLTTAILLVFVNWGLESRKWQILTSHLQPMTFWRAVKSVMAGVSFTMLTPNRMGEFLGRVLYLPDGSRIRAATLTFLSSLSQLVITMAMGGVGLFLLKKEVTSTALAAEGWTSLLINGLLFSTFLGVVIGLIAFFNIGWVIRVLEKFPPFSKFAFYVHVVGEIHYRELLRLLSISLFRYLVFLVQYLLVFSFFEVGISPEKTMVATAVMFLLLAIVPTIALAELGIRGKISLYVFGLFSVNSLEILAGTAVIWMINIIFPAVAGSFMLLGVKIFRK